MTEQTNNKLCPAELNCVKSFSYFINNNSEDTVKR